MQISSLYNKHPNETIYVVGTGPSLRLFPVDFLKDKITIGLNRVWENFTPSYILTIHPETLPTLKHIPIQFYNCEVITKIKGNIKGVEDYYFFQNNKDVKDFKFLYSKDDTLYVGRGIHTSACVLAAKMGARTIVLVGVDMGEVNCQHHVTNQSNQFHGIPPKMVYREYYINLVEVRKKLREHYKVEILTLSPLMGLHNIEEDFEILRLEKAIPLLPVAEDVSKYKRKNVDFQ